MGTITKNYLIIILFEKIIMKKECQYYHERYNPWIKRDTTHG
jgi:hypothetical protein